MLNQVISFQSENSLSSASRIHPPVTNKCRHFSTGSCKLSHIYDGILPLLALCSMLLFLLFCLPLLTFTRNQIQQKVLAYAIAPPILQTHVAFLPGVGSVTTRRNAIPKYSLDYTITVNTCDKKIRFLSVKGEPLC